MDSKWLAKRFSLALAACAALLAGAAVWHYLMGNYDRILLPSALALLLLIASLLRAASSQVRLSGYLALIAGYLMLALELPQLEEGAPTWVGLAPLLTVLLLPPAPAILLNLALAPIWLMLVGDDSLTSSLALGYLAMVVVTALIPWEQQRQQALLKATDPRDPQCDAVNRTTLHERLASEFQRTQLLHQPLSVIVIHLPQLEMATEQFGPRAHQGLLDALCRTTRHRTRHHDFLGRQGPATFWLVLPSTGQSGAQMVQGRLEEAFHRTVLVDTGRLQAVTGLCQRLAGESWSRFEQRLLATTRRLTES
ncbi:diguanylate cyclase domain-containing protein [Halomonas sp. E14]|uniref:diguanylate cyclase domain-containing protein n=2 Tax=unclassified Halomonas TaxID=2609666 RepID=UPI00403E923C